MNYLGEYEQLKMRIIISGGTGLVGSKLTALLKEEGHEVWHLSRNRKSSLADKTILWDVKSGELAVQEMEGADYIIHLAGAGLADKHWSKEYKQLIASSRIQSTKLLYNTLKKLKRLPKGVVSASAVGYYGLSTTDNIYGEDDPPGGDFLATTCVEWEKEVDRISTLGLKTSKIRIGLVLSKEGGALKEIAKPVKIGFGAPLGSGNQFMPWVHIEDLCRIFMHCMDNSLSDTFNGVAPEHINNRDFTKKVGQTLKRPLWLPNVPAFVLKLILGERAQLVLEGSRVSSQKIEKSGYQFRYRSLQEALHNIYG